MYCISFMSFPHPQINSSVYSSLNFFLNLYQHSNPAYHSSSKTFFQIYLKSGPKIIALSNYSMAKRLSNQYYLFV